MGDRKTKVRNVDTVNAVRVPNVLVTITLRKCNAGNQLRKVRLGTAEPGVSLVTEDALERKSQRSEGRLPKWPSDESEAWSSLSSGQMMPEMLQRGRSDGDDPVTWTSNAQCAGAQELSHSPAERMKEARTPVRFTTASASKLLPACVQRQQRPCWDAHPVPRRQERCNIEGRKKTSNR